MKEVTNLHTQPLELEDGTILAAAGTEGATKTVKALGERDEKRLVRRGFIFVRDKELKAVSAVKIVADATQVAGEGARGPKETTNAEHSR